MTYPTKACKCGKTTDLRPYGKNFSWVCFDCAMATPESQAIAEKCFEDLLDAAGEIAVIGKETGPEPLERIEH